jgi:hypothetical protein
MYKNTEKLRADKECKTLTNNTETNILEVYVYKLRRIT